MPQRLNASKLIGCCLELALRPRTQHLAAETEFNVERIAPMAQRLCAAGPEAPLLLRLDAGFDSAKLGAPSRRATRWVCRRRTGSSTGTRAVPMSRAWPNGSTPSCGTRRARPGKRVALWKDELRVPGIERPLHRVLRLVERTIDRRRQQLIVPEYAFEGWSTSLPRAPFGSEDVIALYAGHGTHEQSHAEFKSELDQQRLPQKGRPCGRSRS